MPRPLRDSPYIYGFHDPGGEQLMLDAGSPGWVLVTEAIGHDPNDRSGADYRRLSDRDLGVIVRLNNAYNPGGTIPYERDYAAFAQRCANFVAASQGAHLWIIGNETNHPIEWPGAEWNWGPGWPAPVSPDKRGEEITPARYATCFRACRAAIKAVPGHGQDQVLAAGPAPWNILLTYAANPNGDWVKYFADLLGAIGPGNLDGITLHTYTHGASPALITSEEKLGDARFAQRRFHFRAYQDFMAAIPAAMRTLPVYITETNQGDQAWENTNSGWVRAAYGEIDAWNGSHEQKIRSLLLYRWPRVQGDRWGIEGLAGVIEDFRQALGARYRWGPAAEDPWADLARRVAELEQRADEMQAALAALRQAAADARALREAAERIAAGAAGAAALRAEVDAVAARIAALEAAVGAPPPDGPPADLVITDLIGRLPVGPGAPYPARSLAAIRRVIVHHTVTAGSVSPERLAQAAIGRGLPGITYHYVISGDGTIYATQPLEAAVQQTNVAAANGDGIGIALAGNFQVDPPPAAQLAAAARLIAHLLPRFALGTDAVIGRREIEATASPGNQWLTGAKYKDALLAQVAALLAASADDAEALKRQIRALEAQVATLASQAATLGGQIASLDQQLAAAIARAEGLQLEVAALTAQAGQVAPLQARVAELEQTIAGQAAEIDRLRGLLGATTGGRVPKPEMLDVVDQLPKHPTLPPYAARTRPISMIVVHHTDTAKTTTVQQIAQYHVYGERKSASGEVIKAQWPGVGYHFIISPDGVIHQCQRESTRSYHVGGDPNDTSVAISLIGRFMTKNYDGTDRAPEDRVPTPEQLRSAGRLAAWLMQEHKVPLEEIKGHRDVWPKATVCPGEHWKTGLNWYPHLIEQVEAAQTATGGLPRMELYLLLWDHGAAWAESDWRGAQAYIAAFRPTAGFRTDDALHAAHVVIVGGPAGVSGADEARLRAAGCDVHRLNGANEAETQAMLDALVRAGTPWPGAATRKTPALARETLEAFAAEDILSFPDEWTMPDGWSFEGGEGLEMVGTTPARVIVPVPCNGQEERR